MSRQEGRNEAGTSPVSRQSYILTYYRLRKREASIALGSHQGSGGEGGEGP